MKSKAFASILTLLLLGFVAPSLTRGQAASGKYQLALEDGYTKYLEFDAQKQADGSTTGSLLLSDEAPLVYRDVDGTGDVEAKYPGFYVKADFDDLVVTKNQAVMSGLVRDSSIRELVGLRVLLTVEDNGDNTKEPDKVTWGLYKPLERNWTPSDAELKEDPGVGLRWLATDAERKDDEGFMMPKDESISTKSFPVSSYAFVESDRTAGDILVRP
jgi:hypothetical protein